MSPARGCSASPPSPSCPPRSPTGWRRSRASPPPTPPAPFPPPSFSNRMETIQGFHADESAGTRLAVWAWTWDYAQHHPFGGGFGAYRSNHIQVQTVNSQTSGDVQMVTTQTQDDEARAYHSAYFEMLGEQGFPGIFLFLTINHIGVVRMEIVRRRYRRQTGEDVAWIAPRATALQPFRV